MLQVDEDFPHHAAKAVQRRLRIAVAAELLEQLVGQLDSELVERQAARFCLEGFRDDLRRGVRCDRFAFAVGLDEATNAREA
jgi:hypothetical protein